MATPHHKQCLDDHYIAAPMLAADSTTLPFPFPLSLILLSHPYPNLGPPPQYMHAHSSNMAHSIYNPLTAHTLSATYIYDNNLAPEFAHQVTYIAVCEPLALTPLSPASSLDDAAAAAPRRFLLPSLRTVVCK